MCVGVCNDVHVLYRIHIVWVDVQYVPERLITYSTSICASNITQGG